MNPSDIPLATKFKQVTAYASDTIMIDAFPEESEALQWFNGA